MEKNFFTSRILPILLTAFLTITSTSFVWIVWHFKNPRYVIITENQSDKISKDLENKGNGEFNPQYAITFDKNKVTSESVKKFNEVKNMLEQYYYKDIDQNKLLEGTVAGMAYSLEDPYTVYFPKEQMVQFSERTQGSYVGVGINVVADENGLLTIVEPFKDSPAIKAGLQKGDKIIRVDDKDVSGLDENVTISMIKGKENTDVKITVFRPSVEKSLDFTMKRKEIKIENISSEVIEDNIGYIRISMFDNDAAKYFGQHLNGLLDKGIKGLVIDLRDNPGGDYQQVTAIADRLLPEGLIVYTEDKAGNRVEEKSDPKSLDMPIMILVNGNSASASEVLSGAVKDHKRGTLIGTKTFGKGLVQAVLTLDDGSGLKVTVARYFTPSGVCIQDIGIAPDVEIKLNEKYEDIPVSQIPINDDSQLQKAIQLIKDKF